jgi:hypothetical protein
MAMNKKEWRVAMGDLDRALGIKTHGVANDVVRATCIRTVCDVVQRQPALRDVVDGIVVRDDIWLKPTHDAAARYEYGAPTIALNPRHMRAMTYECRRFVIAHELAHLVLRHTEQDHQTSAGHMRVELEADALAHSWSF